MKVMVFVKANPEIEAGAVETEQDRIAMDKYNEELVKAGIRLDVGGLKEGRECARINFGGKRIRVTDGPFTETKELVVGFWIWQVRSMEEAIEWGKRCPLPSGGVGMLELRPFYEASDFS